VAGIDLPQGTPRLSLRASAARLVGATAVVALGLLALWQAGVLFQEEGAAEIIDGAVSLAPVDMPAEAPNPAGLRVGLNQGDLAPDFVFSAFDGRRLRLSDFRGGPVLLNFWATWCVPCKQELPDMETLLRLHQAEGLAVIAVNAGEAYGPASRFLQRLEVELTAFGYDPKGDVVRRYAVEGMPTSYFIDADGVIRRVIPGQMSLKLMESMLQETLAP
jgi:thiol-disulfide isomerase/thioredoxin